MVNLFQAQAQGQPTMTAILFYRKRFLCLGLPFHYYWQEIISSKLQKSNLRTDVIFSAKLCFFFFTFCLLWLFQWLFVSVMPVEEEDQAEGKKKSKACWTSRASHAQFLVRLATKIVAFFIKLADFALVGPAGPISDVAQSLTATSMV